MCPDYDLCSACEDKGMHPGHNMMRMTGTQGTWPNHFFRLVRVVEEELLTIIVDQLHLIRPGSVQKYCMNIKDCGGWAVLKWLDH